MARLIEAEHQSNPATPMPDSPYTEPEKNAMNHIAKMCSSCHKAAASYLALMRAVKLRLELEGYTPPTKPKTK